MFFTVNRLTFVAQTNNRTYEKICLVYNDAAAERELCLGTKCPVGD